MANVEVAIEVVCDCGAEVDAEVRTKHREQKIHVTPCKACLDTAKSEGDTEGYARAEAEAAEGA